MARYTIPSNIGRVRLVMGLGGTYTVWNGKHGKHEFTIVCRTKKQAQEVCERINKKQHSGAIEVLS